MTRLAAALFMVGATLAGAGGSPSTQRQPAAALARARHGDELHVKLAAEQPPHFECPAWDPVGPSKPRFSWRPIKAGNWHLVGDGVVFESTDITFDVIWRDAGGTDHPIVSYTHHFDPQPSGFNAVLYEATRSAPAVPAKGNDQLVLRMSAPAGTYADGTMLWIPNGDAETTMGRDPSLTLPR